MDVNGTVSIAGGSQFNDDVRINSGGTLTIVDLGAGATRNVVVNQFGDLEATTLTTPTPYQWQQALHLVV